MRQVRVQFAIGGTAIALFRDGERDDLRRRCSQQFHHPIRLVGPADHFGQRTDDAQLGGIATAHPHCIKTVLRIELRGNGR